ncbi:MAG TPA: hypothetical protein VN039_01160 [Nitrospira sp.]|jgi:hypothetical protein|nr:hypothetical protein [Nitrospira sp.]
MSEYEGPTEIGYANWPGRGTTYHFPVAGKQVEIYVTEKQKRVRLFVDAVEWKPADV